MAIAELGYASNAFFAAVDLREKQPLVDVTLLGPPAPLSTVSDAMYRGLSASFRVPEPGSASPVPPAPTAITTRWRSWPCGGRGAGG